MVDALQFFGGLALLALAFFDFVQTAIGTAGIGPVSKRIARLIFRAARVIVPRVQPEANRVGLQLERAVGPVVLCGIAMTWVVMSWAAYTLLLLVGSAAELSDGGTPTVSQVMALAGASLSTLGSSEARPDGGWWDVLTTVAAINGMVMLTLSVSFMMNVWQTTSEARAVALRISAVHDRANEMSDEEVAQALSALGVDFGALVVAIRGVPVVAYFSTEHERMNFAISVLRLCDLVERADRVPASPGYAELRIAMGELATLQDEVRIGLDEMALLRRWANLHRIVC